MTRIRIARSIAVGAAIVAYAVLAHRVNASGAASLQGAILAAAPLLLIALALLLNARTRLAGLAAGGLLLALLWFAWPLIARHSGLLFWLQDIGLLLTLQASFGYTLLPGRKPLCVTFAEMAHGTPLPSAHMAYARQVTVAWTVFFALLAMVSTGLFLLAPLAIWSFYANFLVLPLIALMFVAEYLVRRRVLAGEAGHLLDAVHAYSTRPAPMADTTYPLLTHALADTCAWRDGQPLSAARFVADAMQLAVQLPEGGHVLNVCRDRYHFAVGFAAALLAGKVSLLPPTHTPDMVRQLQAYAPDVFCLHDAAQCDIALPQLQYTQEPAPTATITMPQIPAAQLAAIVFTSGSTGAPQPHRKTWGSLVRNVRAQAARLELTPGHTIVGTVPPQHMYGFESTVLLPLQSGNALSSAHPFYPADIVGALQAVSAPRMLVSTPLHLRMLLEAALPLHETALVLSATAPLSPELAEAVETAFHAPLLEIYGSTETGQIASRRTTQGDTWQLFPEVRLVPRDERIWAEGGHVELPIALNDKIDLLPEGCFLLQGRLQDLVNIAGKRSSLAHLNVQLTSIPGVIDGAFYMPDETSHDHVTRLAACVVAPGLDARTVLAALRERIDPVFLPRPLVFVDALPRNSTGKLPREALKNLIEQRFSRDAA